MPKQALEIVNRLESLFSFVIDEVASNEVGLVVVRSNISDPKGASLFVKELEKITDSRFVSLNRIKPFPLQYHKKWICQHSVCDKYIEKRCNITCKASVEILIKKVTKDSIQEDKFLKLDNPLPCIIKLFLVHTHCKHITEVFNMASVIREGEHSKKSNKAAPRRNKVSSYSNKSHELHSEEGYTDEMESTDSDSDSGFDVQTKVPKRKQTFHELQSAKKPKKEKVCDSNVNNADFQAEQEEFSYIQLTDNLDKVVKPTTRWTASSCQQYVVCVKWDAAYYNEWKVIVCQDLTAKVFLRDEEVPSLGIKIHSVENLSSLLLAVNELATSEENTGDS